MSGFADEVEARRPILTDGGIETRIMFETSVEMEPNIGSASLLDDPFGRESLREIYVGYLDVAVEHDLPIVIGTPSFRASANFVAAGGFPAEDVARLNAEAVAFHQEIRQQVGHERTYVAGVIGPARDAYQPRQAPGEEAAAEYHREQADALALAGVNLLYAPTFPSVAEAAGCCRAMGQTGLPFVIGWVLGPDGEVLDGTPLAEAVSTLDELEDTRPLHHSLSCVHPSVAAVAVERLRSDRPALVPRVAELKANGSPLPTDRLIQLEHPESDPPGRFGAEMAALYDPQGLHVLGGCCGTTDEHIEALASRLALG